MRSQAIISVLLVAAPLVQAAVTCLKVGATATATWTNSASKSCNRTGVVDSNFGINTANGGELVLPFHPSFLDVKFESADWRGCEGIAAMDDVERDVRGRLWGIVSMSVHFPIFLMFLSLLGYIERETTL
jgi:hypothetical protein